MLKEKFKLQINKSLRTLDSQSPKTYCLTGTITQSTYIYENGRTRGHQLALAFKYLLSIYPTSIEPERAFQQLQTWEIK